MKKFIVLLLCLVLFMVGAKVVKDGGRDKLPKLDWETEGTYDIDSEGWFDAEEAILMGSQENTKLSSGNVNRLTLQAAGCKIRIASTEGEDFYYAFENMKKVQAYQREAELFVRAVRKTELTQETEESVLTLYVPKQCSLDMVQIELGAGSIQAEVLRAKEMEISVGAGKMTVDSLNAEALQLTLGAGAVSFRQGSLKNADFSVGAGSLNFSGEIQEAVTGECAMGNLQMSLEGTEQDFDYEIQCVAGKIQLAEEVYAGVNESKRIDNEGTKYMELNCAMGNMTITFIPVEQAD